MKDNILILSGDPYGGIRKHTHSILNELSNSYNFFYIYGDQGDEVFKSEIKDLKKKCTCFKLIVKKFPHPIDVYNIFYIFAVIKKNNIKLIHAHGAKAGLYSRIVTFFCKIKVIYCPHGGVVHDVFPKYQRLIYNFAEKFLKSKTDIYFFESSYTKKKMFDIVGKINRSKYQVIHNGIDLERVDISKNNKLRKSRSKIVNLVVIASLRRLKGVDIAIMSLKQLNSTVDNNYSFNLVICGDGHEKNNLENLVAKLKLKTKVRFYYDIPDVSSIIDIADIILIPSRHESFGYVALEAGVRKKVIISAAVGGLRDILNQKNSIIVKKNEPDYYTKEILNYLKNSHLYKKKRVLYNDIKNKFLIKNMIQDIELNYRYILEKE
ncbi:glycosyltransferase [Methylophilaceae bacterium Uisw_097]